MANNQTAQERGPRSARPPLDRAPRLSGGTGQEEVRDDTCDCVLHRRGASTKEAEKRARRLSQKCKNRPVGRSSYSSHTWWMSYFQRTTALGQCQSLVFTHSICYRGYMVHSVKNATEENMPSDERMSIDERRKYLKLVAPRYSTAGRSERSGLLTEMTAVTGRVHSSKKLPGQLDINKPCASSCHTTTVT